jgi:hypothetical protein
MVSRRSVALFAALLTSPGPSAVALPRPDVPDGGAPFLHAAAPDVSQLVRAVRRDPEARHRYALVFHVPAGQIPLFLQHNFVPAMLPRTDLYTVSLISHRGTIYPVWMTLPAGTPVFLARDGGPMLLRATGDPAVAVAPPAQPDGGEQIIVPTEDQFVPLPTSSRPAAAPPAP